ncbi:MAG: cystathionine beta-lyase/cystathionine gamma-synthase [Motiliproteus sp.]|jgi:cystathionine beta-lyase/cystathionine gamma-synthase
MRTAITILSGALTLALSLNVSATEPSNLIPMRLGNATTFYIQATIGSLEAEDFMVDTGSGYMTINEVTLSELQHNKQASYQRDLLGVLANGSEIRVPVYRLSQVVIGNCTLRNIDAALFPGKTRQIIGLNALKRAGSFTFSFDPPQLELANCPQPEILAAAETLMTAAVAE